MNVVPFPARWRTWFAWRPVLACGRTRWLVWVLRHRVAHFDGLEVRTAWEYRALLHDLRDVDPDRPRGVLDPATCRGCGLRFWP